MFFKQRKVQCLNPVGLFQGEGLSIVKLSAAILQMHEPLELLAMIKQSSRVGNILRLMGDLVDRLQGLMALPGDLLHP